MLGSTVMLSAPAPPMLDDFFIDYIDTDISVSM